MSKPEFAVRGFSAPFSPEEVRKRQIPPGNLHIEVCSQTTAMFVRRDPGFSAH